MNSKELFLNIYQIKADPALRFNFPLRNINHFDRNVAVHIARNSGKHISHITMEFPGTKACYLCVLTFNTPNDLGIGLFGFAMMHIKLTLPQKALVLLSCLKFLIDNKLLNADFNYFKEKISMDLNDSGRVILDQYDKVCAATHSFLKEQETASTQDTLD
jgi:hypothetical protein